MVNQLCRAGLLTLLCFFCAVSTVWGKSCPKRPACIQNMYSVKANVTFNKTKPFIDTRHSQHWINRRSKGYIKGTNPVGITETQISHRTSATYTICSDSRKREQCLYLTEASLDVSYQNTTVYIAKQYPPGSCEYRAIYQHEAEHVRILNSHQSRFKPIFRANLLHIMNTIRPVSSRDPQRGKQKMSQQLQRRMKKKFRSLEKSLKRAHAAIDTARNYAKIQSKCRNW